MAKCVRCGTVERRRRDTITFLFTKYSEPYGDGAGVSEKSAPRASPVADLPSRMFLYDEISNGPTATYWKMVACTFW